MFDLSTENDEHRKQMLLTGGFGQGDDPEGRVYPHHPWLQQTLLAHLLPQLVVAVVRHESSAVIQLQLPVVNQPEPTIPLNLDN